MSKKLLEEIKNHWYVPPYDSMIENEDVNWLIEQAELVEELEKIIDKFDGHSVRNGKEIMRLADENADLKVKNKWLKYEMEREKHVGDKLEQQNKRYRETMEEILDNKISCWEVIENKLNFVLYKE